MIKSSLNEWPKIVSNDDKINVQNTSESDIAAFAAAFLLERGYPVLYTDEYSLQNTFFNNNYKEKE